jgi:hypothetical protein
MDPKKLVRLQKEKYPKEHWPKQFTGTGTQLMVMDFIDQVKHYVRMGGGYGLTNSDHLIDIVI